MITKQLSSRAKNLILAKSPLDIKGTKDNFFNLPSINNLDIYVDFSYSGRQIIKQKYYKVQGIYLWINNINKRSYVGKSVNIFNRLNKIISCAAAQHSFIYRQD